MKPKGIASVTGTTRSPYPRLTVLTGQDHATSVVVKVGTVWNRPETGSLSQRRQAQDDLQHQFNASFVYELPVGKGRRWGGGSSGLREKLIGGNGTALLRHRAVSP